MAQIRVMLTWAPQQEIGHGRPTARIFPRSNVNSRCGCPSGRCTANGSDSGLSRDPCKRGRLLAVTVACSSRRFERMMADRQSRLQSANPEHPLRLLVVEDDARLRRLYELDVPSWIPPVHLELAKDGFRGTPRSRHIPARRHHYRPHDAGDGRLRDDRGVAQ
jgi:hypothetical protein